MAKGASKLKAGKRIKLTSDSNEYDLHVIADVFDESQDDIAVFFAVTSTTFGQSQSIGNLLDDFKKGFYECNNSDAIAHAQKKGDVNKASQSLLQSLTRRYGANKLGDVQNKVDQVR
jgi:hypothetical protein